MIVHSYLCGGYFIASDYKYVDSIKLNDNAVPSIFKLPEHFMKIVKTRKSPVKRKFVEVSNSVTLSEECSNTCSNSNTSTNNSPSKEECSNTCSNSNTSTNNSPSKEECSNTCSNSNTSTNNSPSKEECSNTCSNSNTSTNNSPSKEELKEKLIEHKENKSFAAKGKTERTKNK